VLLEQVHEPQCQPGHIRKISSITTGTMTEHGNVDPGRRARISTYLEYRSIRS
jgi:hypothetical protein